MLTLRAATEDDHTAISVLLNGVYGQPNEHTLVGELRAAGQMAIELVTVGKNGLVGHICMSELSAPQKWLALAPLTVRQGDQRKGIGGDLVRYALDQARQKKYLAVVVVGNPQYYSRFGFVFEGPSDIQSPYPKQYTGLYPIQPETAKAKVMLAYPEPFQNV